MAGLPRERDIREWGDELETVAGRLAPHFTRREPRERAVAYVRCLLGNAERKNGWQLAEEMGDPTPDGVQHLLARAIWDADAVRDELLRYVAETLGHPDGVLIVDETGFLKKGTESAGVGRQYSGTAGRIENAQIGVFLGYASERGRALLDRELYLPKDWATDVTRRQKAGIPEEVTFATKIALGRRMISRAVGAGVPAKWVTADSVYGSDYHFRLEIEGLGLGYVVAVRSDHAVHVGWRQARANALADEIPKDSWQRLSCGSGSKGPRLYEWALLNANCPKPRVYKRWLLFRRSLDNPGEVVCFACGGPPGTTINDLVKVAGARWAIEDLFELAKGDCGLDEYEVRSWIGWHRHITLSLWALATLAVIRRRAGRGGSKKRAVD